MESTGNGDCFYEAALSFSGGIRCRKRKETYIRALRKTSIWRKYTEIVLWSIWLKEKRIKKCDSQQVSALFLATAAGSSSIILVNCWSCCAWCLVRCLESYDSFFSFIIGRNGYKKVWQLFALIVCHFVFVWAFADRACVSSLLTTHRWLILLSIGLSCGRLWDFSEKDYKPKVPSHNPCSQKRTVGR